MLPLGTLQFSRFKRSTPFQALGSAADFIARLRYHWRLFWGRRKRSLEQGAVDGYLDKVARVRLKTPFHLADFLQSCPQPLVAATSLVDGLARFFPSGRLCSFGVNEEQVRQADLLVCWLKADLGRVAALAHRTGQPVLLAEDAFLKSVLTVKLPGDSRYKANTAIFFDDLGYHYDASRPSRLEVLLNSVDLKPEEIRRGAAIRKKLVESRLSKYNHQPLQIGELGRPGRKKVLVVDQCFGDASVHNALASSRTFRLMLKAALKENPEADIIVKKHPDAIAQEGRIDHRTSYFQDLKAEERIFHLNTEANPYAVIEQVEAVYNVSSNMGLDALMAGKIVHVFGLPAYAGWGLTRDRLKCPRRTKSRTLDELVFIIYVLYTNYAAKDGYPLTAEEAIDQLLELRNAYFRLSKTGFEAAI